MAHLVFDIGGSKTRAAVFDDRARTLVASAVGRTPNHLDLPHEQFDDLRCELLALMSRLARQLTDDVSRVDVAFAGPLDASGAVVSAPTLWGTRQPGPYRLDEDLSGLWPHARVSVLNDVSAAGYRYLRAGEDLCIVTVSSGIGHKLFLGGRPVLGARGAGGELGHLLVDDSAEAPLCECGGRGHLGAIGSGRGVLLQAQKRDAALTSGDLVAAFHRGEQWALTVIAGAATLLGRALAAMHLGMGVERFVIIGGFALALGDAYRRLVARALGASCWRGDADFSDRVELGIDDDHSGLIGAGIAGVLEEKAR